MTGAVVWVDGVLGGRIDPSDRGLTLGDGVFDTLTAFDRIPFAGAAHLARLLSQAGAIGISVAEADVRAGWTAVLERAEARHLILRTTVTRGPAGRGLWPAAPTPPTLIVSATPWNPALFGAPVRLVTSAISRNPGSPAARLKTIGYLDHILAAREAAEKSADDALFLTPAGRVACTTIANIFVLEGDRLLTPPAEDGVMPGIMRRLVLEAAESVDLRPAERSLVPDDCYRAGAVFLTNSVRFIVPVLSLDGVPLHADRAEKVSALLMAIAKGVDAECGSDPRMLEQVMNRGKKS